MKTPSWKSVPSGPVMAASHSKKLSSLTGPAAIPSGGFRDICLYSDISRRSAEPAIFQGSFSVRPVQFNPL